MRASSEPQHPGVTIGEWVTQSATRRPDADALIDAGTGVAQTYAATNARVNRLVHALHERGVGRGDRLGIVSVDRIEYVETILAAMKLGATYVPLNFRLTTAELSTLLARAEPSVVFFEDRYAAAVGGVEGALPVCFDGATPDGGSTFADLIASGSETEPPRVAVDDDVLGLAFTSGTTGLPKGVLQSQRMIKHMIMNVLVDYRVRPDDVRYNAAPLFHISGMAMTLMSIAIGAATVIHPQFDAAVTARLLAEDRLTACFLVPTMVSALLAEPGIDRRSYDRLDLMMYGAAPMTPTLLRRAMDVFDCDFLNAFGAGTEAGLQTVLTPADHRAALAGRPEILGSIGRAATAVSLRLVDDDGCDVADGEVGEIVTRSDSVMDGYLDMPDATARAFRAGWFRAGDLARRDADGYLYLAGRADDMIIRGGENLHPLEIEMAIAEHPAVDQAIVVGAPDDHWGQVVHAYVTARAGHVVDPDELAAHCRERLAGFKVPTSWYVVDTLPMNASGKVLRRELPSVRPALVPSDSTEPSEPPDPSDPTGDST